VLCTLILINERLIFPSKKKKKTRLDLTTIIKLTWLREELLQ
jgi:hypothetical protein